MASDGDRRPNILHLCTDGQRFDSIGALGNPVIQTPHLDRLAKEGAAFTNAYTTTAMCTPARASMLYGRHPIREPERIWPDETTTASVADHLSEAGYQTHAIGKRDFAHLDERRGFQGVDAHEELLADPGNDDYLVHLREAGYDHLVDPTGVRGELYYLPQPAQMPAEHHVSHWVADRALDFIDTARRDGERPWYLHVSWPGPRPPVSVPSPWYKLYRTPLVPPPNVPADSASLLTHINRVQNRYKFRDAGIDRHAVRSLIAFTYAAVSFIDFQIGRITERLESTGQLDDTMIVFHSDHGELLGDYDSFGPRSFHDGASRIPLLVRYPDRFDGGVCSARMASLVDIAPTLLSAAGIDVATPDGVDLASLARDEVERDHVVNWYRHEMGFLVDGIANRPAPDEGLYDRQRNSVYTLISEAFKYVYSAADDREYLIDRTVDPRETRNVAGNPFYAAELARLRATLTGELAAAGMDEAVVDGEWRRFPPLDGPGEQDPADAGLLLQDQSWATVDLPGYEAPPLGIDPIAATDTEPDVEG